ncbi:hypothetical protein R3P38DRAFT_3216571 [Favolaschia claudopus]|uniref:Ubiquitin-like protease family profile domain-containing protein n=1 Tax=Favolaschia claudopus TaxID=2862362 RepID=A0AAW0A7L6_9AGAR
MASQARRKPGRPKKQRKKKKSSTPEPNSGDEGALSNAPSPGSATGGNEGEPPVDGTILQGEEARLAVLAASGAVRIPELSSGPSHRQFLNAKSFTKEGWALLHKLRIEDLAAWFDDQPNDYNIHSMSPPQNASSRDNAVIVNWIGHPGDSPRDPRARRCFLRWNDPPPSQDAIVRAGKRNQPVVRWVLRCAGAHDLAVGEDGSEKEEEEEDSSGSNNGGAVGRWKGCENRVRLHVEVYPGDLTLCYVYQQYTHADVELKLRWEVIMSSRIVRCYVLERMRLGGFRPSSIAIEVQNLSPQALGRTTPLPDWRHPTPKQIKSMYAAAKQRELLDRNPWRATHLLARRNQDKIFAYVPHDFQKPDVESEFSIGLTDNYSLESGIAYAMGSGGLGSDQCWRHKSQNRAALSILCTVDEKEHMVPVSMFISAHADEATILRFYVGTYEKVMERAQSIVDDPTVIIMRGRTTEIQAQIKANAETIIVDGWQIGEVMIDKHRPSLKALKQFQKLKKLVFAIRICQFHVIRAILLWEWSDGTKGLSRKIPLTIKAKIARLFRYVQRARTLDEFEDLSAQFLVTVEELIMQDEMEDEDNEEEDDDEEVDDDDVEATMAGLALKKKGKKKAGQKEAPPPAKRVRGLPRTQDERRNMAEAVVQYFESEWFTPEWIPHFTDIGLPPTQTRDGIWNTNNWSETAFRTFDTVFLGSRSNKRIDRLALIVLNSFLPYFQSWRPPDRPVRDDVLAMHQEAYSLWDRGAIRIVNEVKYKVVEVVEQISRQFEVTTNPVRCQCRSFVATGKKCVHILAVELYISETERQSERAIGKRKKSDPKRVKQRNDEAESKEVYKVLGVLAAEEEAEERQPSMSPEPAFEPDSDAATEENENSFAAMGRQSGRPPNTTPLQRRRQSKKSGAISKNPQFAVKSGRPSAGRAGQNSVFPAGTGMGGNDERLSLVLPRVVDAQGDGEMDVPENWGSEGYELRWKVVEQWAQMFNLSEVARRHAWVFLVEGPDGFAAAVRRIKWSKKATSERLKLQRLGDIAEIFSARGGKVHVDHLVFFQCLETAMPPHWTLVHHDLRGESSQVELLDPLRQDNDAVNDSSEGDRETHLRNQIMLGEYLHPHSTVERNASTKKPQIHNTMGQVTFRHFHVQQADSPLCGFWAVFMSFALILQIEMEHALVQDMRINPMSLKEPLAAIYASFKENEAGVPVDLVRQLFSKFRPGLNFSTLKNDYFFTRNAESQSPMETLTPPPPSDAPHTFDDDAALSRLIDPEQEDCTWLIGAHRLTTGNLRDVREKKSLHCVVLDAYLEVFMGDVGGASKVLVVDTLLSKEMQDATKGSGPNGMAPKPRAKHERKFWFEQDIFQLDRLIIPWFSGGDHWMIVAVEFKMKHINIYNSFKAGDKGGRRAKAATERTYRMLMWEHVARYGTALSKDWSDIVCPMHVPQQGNTLNCGIYSIWFAKQLINEFTDITVWDFDSDECERERKRILTRLCGAIHRDPQERNIEQLRRLHLRYDPAGLDRAINALERSLAGSHKTVAEAVYPILACTDVRKTLTLDEWLVSRKKRLNNPAVGACYVIQFLDSRDPAIVRGYPAIVHNIDGDKVEFRWFEGIYDTLPDGHPRDETFVLNRTAVSKEGENDFSWQDLARIEWPAHLTVSPMIVPSPLYPHQKELTSGLRSLVPHVLAAFTRPEPTVEDANVFSSLDFRFVKSESQETFYRDYLGGPRGQEPFCAADEMIFTSLVNLVERLVPGPTTEADPRSRTGLHCWIRGAGRAMFATAAAAFYLKSDLKSAMELLQSGRVRRAKGQHEIVLDAYAHVIRMEPAGTAQKVVEERLVIVPGLKIPLPRAV